MKRSRHEFGPDTARRAIRAAHSFGKMFPPLPWELASLPTERYWRGGTAELPESALKKKRTAALIALGESCLEAAMQDENAPEAVKEYVKFLQSQ